MVHTATLTYFLKGAEYQLYRNFIKLDDTVFMPNKTIWCNRRLTDRGITIMAKHHQWGNFSTCLMIIRINFKRVIEQKDRIVVATEKDTYEVAAAFDELLETLLPGMPTFYAWKVNRIDYCVNVRTSYVKEYIELLQKSRIPYNMKIPPNEHRNKCFRPGSYYVISKVRDRRTKKTGSTTINIYDKYQELLSQQRKDPSITDDIVNQGKDILRIEVQCHKPKTEYLKVKHHMESKNIHLFLDSTIGYEVLHAALCNICGTADFQRKGVADAMIDNLKCSSKKKTKLKDIVKSTGSVQQTKEDYISNGVMTKETFNSYLKLLENHNINAVTISDTKHLPGKSYKDGLESLWTLFNDAYMEELQDDVELLYEYDDDIEYYL